MVSATSQDMGFLYLSHPPRSAQARGRAWCTFNPLTLYRVEQYVMGGGGLDIHYGIYRKPTDGVYESSKATNKNLLQSLDWMCPITKDSVVLDLGSGHGGISHELATTYGCKVVGLNISPEQNGMNEEEAKKLGVAELIEVLVGDFNEGLPKDWDNKFSHIVSCEVFCHAASKPALLKECLRVLKPGGGFAFTDIMGADGADEKALKDFTDRNATTEMARPSGYQQQMRDAGFAQVSWWDGSRHLEHYFASMLKVCHDHKEAMLAEGVPAGYLQNWVSSLTERVDIQRNKKVFAWGIFSARKDGPVV